MKKKKRTSFKIPAKEKKFLALLADHITTDDIDALSKQDYGHSAEKHAEKIAYFHKTLDTSTFDAWYPLEVLELYRWIKPSPSQLLEHKRRAFSCAGIAAANFEGVVVPIEFLDTLFPLFESLVILELPNWKNHFFEFLSYGADNIVHTEDKFRIQLLMFLVKLSEFHETSDIKCAYENLMSAEMSMLKTDWEHRFHKTWDAASEPNPERPFRIADANLTHIASALNCARFVHDKAMRVEDIELSQNLIEVAYRIGRSSGKGDEDLERHLNKKGHPFG